MLSLRAGVFRSAALSALLVFALPAVAQVPCVGVCIGFAAGGVSGVPLSPAAMLLLSLLVASAGYIAIRRRSGLMAVLLAIALAGAALTTDIRQALAASLYQVVLGAGNMSSVTLPASYGGPVDVHNSNGLAVTVTSLTVGSDFALDPATTLHVGSVVPASGTLTGAVVVATLAPNLTSDNLSAGSSIVGKPAQHILTFDRAIGAVTIGSLPTGMTVTPSIEDNVVTLGIVTAKPGFTAFGVVTIPLDVCDTSTPAVCTTLNVLKTITIQPKQ